MNLCVIPARGGSKRIPRKNIKHFFGKPIISYPIENAINSKCFDKIIVSTDDDEIKEIAQKYGAEVPFDRPKKLADDHTGILEVVKHAINWYAKKQIHFKNVCCILPTTPLINKSIIVETYELFKNSDYDYSCIVCEFPSSVQRALKSDENNMVQMINSHNYKTRTQDLEKLYYDAGQLYWGKANSYLNLQPILLSNTYGYKISSLLAHDIDSKEDWDIVESLFKIIN